MSHSKTSPVFAVRKRGKLFGLASVSISKISSIAKSKRTISLQQDSERFSISDLLPKTSPIGRRPHPKRLPQAEQRRGRGGFVVSWKVMEPNQPARLFRVFRNCWQSWRQDKLQVYVGAAQADACANFWDDLFQVRHLRRKGKAADRISNIGNLINR